MIKALKSLERMRDDVVDFRDIIEGSSYSTDDDYNTIKKVIEKSNILEQILDLQYQEEIFVESERNGHERVGANYQPVCEVLVEIKTELTKLYKLLDEISE